MAGKSKRPKLILSPEQKEKLTRLSHSLGSPAREVQRARILCRYEAGETITQIAKTLTTTRPSVRKWVNKALAMGADAALKGHLASVRMLPSLPRRRRHGSSHLALAPNRRNTVTRPNYGREVRWLCMFANMRSRPGIRRWRKQGKPPCSAFSRLRSCTRSESITISKKRDPLSLNPK